MDVYGQTTVLVSTTHARRPRPTGSYPWPAAVSRDEHGLGEAEVLDAIKDGLR